MNLDWYRVGVVVRHDLRQLRQSRDFLLPVGIMGVLFFVVLPTLLLLSIDAVGSVTAVQRMADALEVLPKSATENIPGTTPEARTQYALAVYLFAPLAVVVPVTISTAVGASTLVGERERGTGEFLAHSPARTTEIYLGKLIASIVPGYLTTLVGFGVYALIVNTIVGRNVGGWFFPTAQWWILMLWVVPPFLALGLSIVLRISARVQSTSAAQQASGLVSLPLILLSYSQSTGALFGAQNSGLLVGAIAWLGAALSLTRGMVSVRRGRLLGVADET